MQRTDSPQVEFDCPACATHIRLPLRRAFKQHRCPACDESFFVLPMHGRAIEPIPTKADESARFTAA